MLSVSGAGLSSARSRVVVIDSTTTGCQDSGSSNAVPFEVMNDTAGTVSLPTDDVGRFSACHWQDEIGRVRFVGEFVVSAIVPRVSRVSMKLSADGNSLKVSVEGHGLVPGEDSLWLSNAPDCRDVLGGVSSPTLQSDGQRIGTNATAELASPLFRTSENWIMASLCYRFALSDESLAVGAVGLPLANQPPKLRLAYRRLRVFSRERATVVVAPAVIGLLTTGPRPQDANETVSFSFSAADPSRVLSSQDITLHNGSLSVPINARASGLLNITIAATDDGGSDHGGVAQSSLAFLVLDVRFRTNTPPSFAAPPHVTASLASMRASHGAVTLRAVVTNISADSGNATELPTQVVTFVVATSPTGNTSWPQDGLRFVEISSQGDLTLQLTDGFMSDYDLAVPVWVKAVDNGDTLGMDGPSESNWWPLEVRLVAENFPPTFSLTAIARSPIVLRSTASLSLQVVAGFSAGDYGEHQTVRFTVTFEDPVHQALFALEPTIDSAGVLHARAKSLQEADTVALLVSAKDDGGTLGGGSDTSATQSLTLWMAPTFGLVATPSTAVAGARVTLSVTGGHPLERSLGLRFHFFVSLNQDRANELLTLGVVNDTVFHVHPTPPGHNHLSVHVRAATILVGASTATLSVSALDSVQASNWTWSDPAISLLRARLDVLLVSRSISHSTPQAIGDPVRALIVEALSKIRYQERLRPETLLVSEQGLQLLLSVLRNMFPSLHQRRRMQGNSTLGEPASAQIVANSVGQLTAAFQSLNWSAAAAFNTSTIETAADTLVAMLSHSIVITTPPVLWQEKEDEDKAMAEGLHATRKQQSAAVAIIVSSFHDVARLACRMGFVVGQRSLSYDLWWAVSLQRDVEVATQTGRTAAESTPATCASLVTMDPPNLLLTTGNPKVSPRGTVCNAAGIADSSNVSAAPPMVVPDSITMPYVSVEAHAEIHAVELSSGEWKPSQTVDLDHGSTARTLSPQDIRFYGVAQWAPVVRGTPSFAVIVSCVLFGGLAISVIVAFCAEWSTLRNQVIHDSPTVYVSDAARGLSRSVRIARGHLLIAAFARTHQFSRWTRPVRAAGLWCTLVNGCFVVTLSLGQESATAQFQVRGHSGDGVRCVWIAVAAYCITAVLLGCTAFTDSAYRIIHLGRFITDVAICGPASAVGTRGSHWRLAIWTVWQSAAIVSVGFITNTYESETSQLRFATLAGGSTALQIAVLESVRVACVEYFRRTPPTAAITSHSKETTCDFEPDEAPLHLQHPPVLPTKEDGTSLPQSTAVALDDSLQTAGSPENASALRRSKSQDCIWSPEADRARSSGNAGTSGSRDPFLRLADEFAFEQRTQPPAEDDREAFFVL
uniref:Uncharacterized protein n=1 Tax=Neobodo designis TaxID=312471 RepID=A0A7S1L6H5_NEODS